VTTVFCPEQIHGILIFVAHLNRGDVIEGVSAVAKCADRAELERRAEIPHVATRTDTLGRQQPARKHIPTRLIPEEADDFENRSRHKHPVSRKC